MKAYPSGHGINLRVTDEKSLWSLARWSRNRTPRSAFTPDLKKGNILVLNTTDKMKVLQEVFFPKPLKADLSDISGYVYPLARGGEWKSITEHEVRTAIIEVPPNKAPRPDQIPNRMLKVVNSILTLILTKLFNSLVDLYYCPKAFKKSIIIVLQKLRKSNYIKLKLYRLIALINTFKKILNIMLIKKI